MYHLLAAVFVLAVSAGDLPLQASATNQVPVTVYYESLCPDSIKFYINQLYPTMEIANLSEKIDLTLVPYGKSGHHLLANNTYTFECHHGEKECVGNKVHGCAIKFIPSKNERLKFLNCVMKTVLPDTTIPFPTEKCADEVQIGEKEKQAIISCANGIEGSEILAGMGNITNMLEPRLTSVPTVVFNNKYDQNDFKQAQTNFRGVVCKYIPDPKPAECLGTSGAAISSVSFLLFACALFFSHNS